MNDILLQFNWESKNTLISIDFYLRKGQESLISCFYWNLRGSKKTLVWNKTQLVFKRAIDVEWYSKTVSLGIKSLISEYEMEWLISYLNWNHLGIKRNSGMEWDATVEKEWLISYLNWNHSGIKRKSGMEWDAMGF